MKALSFIWFSDIHVDPYFGTPQGMHGCTVPDEKAAIAKAVHFGCDAPPALVQSALAAAASLTASAPPTFVLLTGDMIRHDGDQMPGSDPVRDILTSVVNWTVSAFPTLPRVHGGITAPGEQGGILNTMGNNDVQPDYGLPLFPNETSLKLLADSWRSELTAGEYLELMEGGYYCRAVLPGLDILSLNTVIYSVRHTPGFTCQSVFAFTNLTSSDSRLVSDPFGQFSWLDERLSSAKSGGRAVYIMGHIPPVLESHSPGQPTWNAEYVARYVGILEAYVGVVQAQLFGHFHSDEFRLDPVCRLPPVLIASAVTPVYGNNPNFRVVTYDPASFALLDYTQFAFISTSASDNPSWQKLYSASEAYGVRNLSCSELATVSSAVAVNKSMLATFLRHYHSGAPLQRACDGDCPRTWACLLGTIAAGDYHRCMAGSEVHASKPWALVVLAVLVACALLALMVYVHRGRTPVYNGGLQKSFSYQRLRRLFFARQQAEFSVLSQDGDDWDNRAASDTV